MKLLLALLALGGGIAVASAAPCSADTAICTVPLNFDDDAEPAVIAAPEPEPVKVAPAPPAPIAAPQPAPVAPAAAVATVPVEPVAPPPPPAPVIAAGIVDVLDWQLRDYWQLSREEPPLQTQRSRGRCDRATLTVRFVVKSNGYTDEVRVLRNTALNPLYERRVEDRVRGRFYTPARANPQRQSVRLEETFRLSC